MNAPVEGPRSRGGGNPTADEGTGESPATAPSPPVLPLGLLGGDHPLLQGRTGRGVTVAVLDSGVHPGHPHVGGILSARGVAECPDALDVLGHGTAVAAAIHEKAPEAGILVLKVFHRTLSSTIPTLLEAMDLASSQGARLVNLSLGTWKEEHAPLLQAAVYRAQERGCLVVSALERDGITWYPGALEGVVPVVMDPLCPRDGLRIDAVGGGVRIAASGFPRPIPGVPPERNLNGVSFAVANTTGVLARLLEGRPGVTDLPALAALLNEGESPARETPLSRR